MPNQEQDLTRIATKSRQESIPKQVISFNYIFMTFDSPFFLVLFRYPCVVGIRHVNDLHSRRYTNTDTSVNH